MKISNIYSSVSFHFNSQVMRWKIRAHRREVAAEYADIREYSCVLKLGWFSLDFFLRFVKK